MAQYNQDAVAIIGMGCRFPGGANSPEQLWKLLSEGRDAWSKVPANRFNESAFHHPEQDINGTISHQGGHFLDQDASRFDPSFFGISSLEAQSMDPQQRLQIETAYEALENAGIPLSKIQGTDAAVYMAIFARDYDHLMRKDVDDFGKYHMTGVGDAILANRISYAFDLKGPSMTIDTGCSGSLVALHNACRSIQAGDASLALVGASNLILSPDQMMPMTLLQ
jgi:acyl transferase domain-containing protein